MMIENHWIFLTRGGRQVSLSLKYLNFLKKKNSHKILTLVDSYGAEASIFDESISLVQASLQNYYKQLQLKLVKRKPIVWPKD